jgi:hypothetical protein
MAQTLDLPGPVVRGAAGLQQNRGRRALGEEPCRIWLRESRRR